MNNKLYLLSDSEIRNICIDKLSDRIVVLKNNDCMFEMNEIIPKLYNKCL